MHSDALKSYRIIGLLMAFLALGACDDTITGRASAILELTPDAFRFPAAQPGDAPIDQIVVIKNIGEGTLLLADITGSFANSAAYQLDYRPFDPSETGADEGEFFIGIDPMLGNQFPPNISVEKEMAIALKLRYIPDELGAGGKIDIATNADPSDLEIPILGIAAAGDLAVNPTSLDFGRVESGETKTLDLTLTNVGL